MLIIQGVVFLCSVNLQILVDMLSFCVVDGDFLCVYCINCDW